MKKVCLTIVTAILVTLCIYGVSYAVSMEELENRRIELQKQIEQSGIDLDNLQIELTETLEKINKFDKQIYDYEDNVEEINKTLRNIETEIKTKEEAIKELQQEYNIAKNAFAERIVYLYETNDTRYLDVLLNSKSIVDFISNYYLIGEMAQYDANLIEKIEINKDKLVVAKEALAKTKKELEDKKLEKQKMAIQLENSKVVKNSYLNELSEQEKEMQEKLKVYQNELELVELEMLLSSMENNESVYVGGVFLWPVPRILYNYI